MEIRWRTQIATRKHNCITVHSKICVRSINAATWHSWEFCKYNDSCNRRRAEAIVKKLEATIISMQRKIEYLQAEFVSIREEQSDDCMHTTPASAGALAQNATLFKTGLGAWSSVVPPSSGTRNTPRANSAKPQHDHCDTSYLRFRKTK